MRARAPDTRRGAAARAPPPPPKALRARTPSAPRPSAARRAPRGRRRAARRARPPIRFRSSWLFSELLPQVTLRVAQPRLHGIHRDAEHFHDLVVLQPFDPEAEAFALPRRQRGRRPPHPLPPLLFLDALPVIALRRRRRLVEDELGIVDGDERRAPLLRLPRTDAGEKNRFRNRGKKRAGVGVADLVHALVQALERVLCEVVRFVVGNVVRAEVTPDACVIFPVNQIGRASCRE